MRIMLSLLALLLTSIGAYAQTPQIDRIDVVEYGIYTNRTTSQQAAPDTAGGVRDIVTDTRLAVTTRIVPAQQGAQFGFRYAVVGSPTGTVVPFHAVDIFPPPGLHNPAKPQISTRAEYDFTASIGSTHYIGYGFDDDWEVVPGTWTIQIWYQGRKLAEQSFTVVKQ